jgi:hypothetical protein
MSEDHWDEVMAVMLKRGLPRHPGGGAEDDRAGLGSCDQHQLDVSDAMVN